MIKTGILFAGAFAAFTLTAGSAYAESTQHRSDPARQSYPVSLVDSSGPDAPSGTGSSSEPLRALLRDWDRAGFDAPSKPGQFRVYGRNGYVTSGPGYNSMVMLIRAAVGDAREGRDQEALAKIAKVRSLLDR